MRCKGAWYVVRGRLRWQLRTTHYARLSADSEQFKPPLVSRHDPLPIRRVFRTHQCRIPRDDLARRAARRLEERQVGGEVGVAERDAARLARTGELPHAALLEIELGDLEAVRGLRERLEAGAGRGAGGGAG